MKEMGFKPDSKEWKQMEKHITISMQLHLARQQAELAQLKGAGRKARAVTKANTDTVGFEFKTGEVEPVHTGKFKGGWKAAKAHLDALFGIGKWKQHTSCVSSASGGRRARKYVPKNGDARMALIALDNPTKNEFSFYDGEPVQVEEVDSDTDNEVSRKRKSSSTAAGLPARTPMPRCTRRTSPSHRIHAGYSQDTLRDIPRDIRWHTLSDTL